MSEYLVEKDVNGTSVDGGEKKPEEHIVDHNSTKLLGMEVLVLHVETDNIFPTGWYDMDEENECWMGFFPKYGGERSANRGESTRCGL